MIKQLVIRDVQSDNWVTCDVTATSPFSGEDAVMHMMLNLDDLDRWQYGDALIQNAMPYLTSDQREFLMTGITPEEWEKTFG